jgi:hypothetical protein
MGGFILFTDYYRAERLSSNSKDRFDITHKKGAYEVFETKLINKSKFNVGGLSLTYAKYGYCKAKSERKPEMQISKNGHISGVYTPDLENHKIGYGDVKETSDGLILLFNEDYSAIEIFIARGKKNDIKHIYNQVKYGEYNNEIESLRAESLEVFKRPVTDLVTIDLFKNVG